MSEETNERYVNYWLAARQPLMELFVLCGCLAPQLSKDGKTAFFTKEDRTKVHFNNLEDAFRYGINYLIEHRLMFNNPAWGWYRHTVPTIPDDRMGVIGIDKPLDDGKVRHTKLYDVDFSEDDE